MNGSHITRSNVAGLILISSLVLAFIPYAGVKAAGPAAVGGVFDAVPFGLPLEQAEAGVCGVRWAQPRKIRRVLVEFESAAKLPPAQKVKIQYWHGAGWNGEPDPVLGDPGAHGWDKSDDWTNGQWKDADTRVAITNNSWTFIFAPSGEKEFPQVGAKGVAYRKTLKLRLISPEALPKPKNLKALTDSLLKPLTVRILFGPPASPAVKIDTDDIGYLEVFNGRLTAARPIGDAKITAKINTFYILPKGSTGGIEADLLMAVDPGNPRYDRTVLTVRSKHRPFSFAADEVAAGRRILIDDLGVLVAPKDDAIDLVGYRQVLKEFSGKTVYDRVFEAPEQTLERAWNDMPLKRPLYFVHGLPGNRNAIRQTREGMVEINSNPRWFDLPRSPKDTERKKWKGDTYRIWFTIPGEVGGRELRDGYLPQLRTWYRHGPIYYESQTLLDALHGNMNGVQLDDPSVLLMKLRMMNTSADQDAEARFGLSTEAKGGPKQKLTRQGDRLLAHAGEQLNYLMHFQSSRGTCSEKDNGLQWSLLLKPGEAQEVYLAMPSITLDKDEEIEALRKREFAEAGERVCAFWRDLAAQGAQIQTPEPWLNDFYKAHVRHLAVNCWKEIDGDILHSHVGTFGYGDFLNESMMMITDLDRRGYHRTAERCLENYLQGQGVRVFAGSYKTADGCFYVSAGHECGDYNKNQGYALWGLAEHWRMTRDRTWMERVAPKIIKGCAWIIRERQATMKKDAEGNRPIEYGFLPTGSLEDVRDFWYWLATNAAATWGFTAAADALADFGHPEAARLQKEAGAYRDDLLRGWNEARIRTPVVRLRDATYVPKIPSRLYERGRCVGWLRETLEGAMFLSAYGILPPDDPQTKWILKDYEDNLYISDEYGYQIPVFDRFWFSRGGFSMQPQLLDGPIPYLLRDEIKHYVRAYFNALASSFYPEIRMCNEHCLPELGYPVGDHFKSSDEAQSTYWLRLMLVHELGEDLYLGQAVPRYWLADGQSVSIERAATHFGPLSFRITSGAAQGEIKAALSPLERNRPRNIYVRIRHPEAKPIKSVTLNGQDYTRFDAKKEWVILPGNVEGEQQIVTRY